MSRHRRRARCVGVAGLVAIVLAAAARSEELSVRGPAPAVVKVGGEALATLILDGAEEDAALVPPPAIPGLDVRIGPPSRSSDGRASGRARIAWEIALRPSAEGRFALPPIEVRAGERTLRSPPLAIECVRDLLGERYAFVELSAPRGAFYVNERIPLAIRFGIDEEFREHNLVQLFASALDVPVQLHWTEAPGAAPGAEEPAAGDGADRPTFALGESVARASRAPDLERDGRTFRVLEIERAVRATRPGALELPGPLLRFACATRFELDPLASAVPVDWQLLSVQGAPLVLAIEPLPEEGRPEGFAGAVGRFSVAADVDRSDVEAGESVKLTLRVRGEGDLESLEAPRLDLAGFHVRGTVDVEEREGRAWIYDLELLDPSVAEVPAIPFAFFEPGPEAGYRTVRTEPIRLRVRPRATEPIEPAAPLPTEPAPSGGGAATRIAIAAIAAGLASLLALVRLRRRSANQADR